MSKHDLQARPILHQKREPIEARLTIMFAALTASRLPGHSTYAAIITLHCHGLDIVAVDLDVP